MEKIKALAKKFCTREIILYAIFGVLTTIINLLSFWLLTEKLGIDENLANAIAIILAVLVAYFTNKDMVFHSNAAGIKEKLIEFFKFILGRGFTMIIEWIGGLLLFMTPMPQMFSKLLITVVVIILNFFISKFFAFKQIKK